MVHVQVGHPARAVLDMHIAGVPQDQAFRQLLGAYGEWRDAFSRNLQEVAFLLEQFQRGFAELSAAAKCDEEMQRRDAAIKEVCVCI